MIQCSAAYTIDNYSGHAAKQNIASDTDPSGRRDLVTEFYCLRPVSRLAEGH